MQLINTLSLTSAVNGWLVNTRHPRILHVFDHACNLINERNEVLSVVTPQIGNGPFNLVIENEVLLSKHLNIESPITVFDSRLTLGDLTIHTGNTKLWNPRPDWERLHECGEHILTQLTPLRKINHQPSLPPPLLSTLTTSIVTADISSSLISVRKLAGLGIGLTPAGDDFIIGAILAAWIIHPPEVASVLAKEIAEIAAPLTTSISAAWIKSARRGEAGILWHEFFDALIAFEDVESPMTKLLSVGETSGADALAGFFAVCNVFKERIIDECPS